MKKLAIILASSLCLQSCTPLKSSPKEEKHQMELTIHELQTGIDDLKHDYNCYQTELQILDSKINNQENSITKIKQEVLYSQGDQVKKISRLTDSLQKKIVELEKKMHRCIKDIHNLSSHANESTAAFSQYKERIDELEERQNRKFNEIVKLKSVIQSLAQSLSACTFYKVKKGDSLEKIAKDHQITVDELKKMNHLENDLIVIGQELKIPTDPYNKNR